MKDVDKNELDYELKNNKIINYRISRVDTYDFFNPDTNEFKRLMKLAGVAKVDNREAMRALFITWLLGVKGMNTSDVIMLTKKDKLEKKKIGEEFVNYFKERPVYGNTKNANEVEAHVGDYAKMI